MAYSFRPAQRSQAKPLIGLYSESGCGKTLGALYLARGFAGASGRIGMIETESGRGEAYADIIPGGYEIVSLRDDFSPKNYGEAISAAEGANLQALIIDSASHEWEGAGGVLALAAKNQEAGKKGVIVWQQPKMEHQRNFMLRLLATPISLVILCMRAKYPMQEVKKDGGGKEWVRSEMLEPKQADDILFEMFIHGWIDKAHSFHATKYPELLPELKDVIRNNEPITIETGARLAAWAKGGAAAPDATPINWTARLNEASTKTALLAVGKQLKAAKGTMPADELDTLRAAYDARLKAIGAAKQPAVADPVDAGDIRWSPGK